MTDPQGRGTDGDVPSSVRPSPSSSPSSQPLDARLAPTPAPDARLVGVETEYAIRYAGPEPRPRHDHIFEGIVGALRSFVDVFSGDRRLANQQVFVGNGGAFYYEFQPTHRADGLIEGSTPECRSAGQVVLYQRAQEELLKRAMRRLYPQLARRGISGQIALLKNARDAEGHGYGTHENYEVDVAVGWRLWALRAGLVALLPIVLAANFMVWVLVVVMVAVTLMGLLVGALAALAVPRLRPALARWVDFESRNAPLEALAGVVSLRMTQVLQVPVDLGFGSLYRVFFFARHRRALGAHLASRVIYAGSGCLMEDRTLWTSERATTLTGVHRWVGAGTTHVVFDSGNLLKALWSPQFLRFAPLKKLFRRRQRMQIAYSDSNRCQLAEFLKVGTTLLILDMVDAGWLANAPRLRRPWSDFVALARDPRSAVRLADGRQLDAYALQRWYLEEAQRFVREGQAKSPEAPQVVELWAVVLDQLQSDPASLVGRVDWVTKRYLIEATGLERFAERKKIDLRYSELETGYFDRLADRGLTLELFEPESVASATQTPPTHSPAELRAEILANVADRVDKVFVAWDQIQVGSWLTGRVIRLDGYRRKTEWN